jgi:hypothetical protein
MFVARHVEKVRVVKGRISKKKVDIDYLRRISNTRRKEAVEFRVEERML